jgi:tellurite resistance protein TerC
VSHALHENELPFINGGEHIEWAPDISTWTSLAVIIGSMAVATIASLVAMRREARRSDAAPAGAPVAGPAGTAPTRAVDAPVADEEKVGDSGEPRS